MEWSEVQGKWTELSGKVRSKWGDLTDDDVASVKGDREQLIGRLMSRCGMTKKQAEGEVDTWLVEIGEPRSTRH